MRRSESVFSTNERKFALWAVIAATLVTSGGLLLDQVAGPRSLGIYANDFKQRAMPGVIDARPLNQAAATVGL